MDYSLLLQKLFELQKLNSRKTDLALRVAGIDAHDRSYNLELDLKRSIHRVGGERARFNESGMLQFMSEQRDRDEEVKSEYRDLCKQIQALEEEIEQLLAATAL